MSFSRRDFFKKSLATGAGVAAASVLAPIPTEAQNKPAKKPIPLSVPEDVVPSTGDKVLLNKIRQARYVASKPKVSSLGILHYTDIHGDSIAAKKILSIMDDYAPYIDAVLNTGGAVQYFVEPTKEYPFGAQWWRESGLAEKSLFVLGNHDGAKGTNSKGHKEGSADWDFYGKEKSYDVFFKDYVKGLGCVMPDGNDDPKSKFYKSCFWHKDFPEAKIRLIGADCMHFYDTFRHKTSEQEEWLTARLEDTLDPSNPAYGYSVIVASHYPLDNFEGENGMWDEAAHKFKFNSSPEGGIVIDFKSSAPTPFHTISMKSFKAEKRFAIRQKITNPEAMDMTGAKSIPLEMLSAHGKTRGANSLHGFADTAISTCSTTLPSIRICFASPLTRPVTSAGMPLPTVEPTSSQESAPITMELIPRMVFSR